MVAAWTRVRDDTDTKLQVRIGVGNPYSTSRLAPNVSILDKVSRSFGRVRSLGIDGGL